MATGYVASEGDSPEPVFASNDAVALESEHHPVGADQG